MPGQKVAFASGAIERVCRPGADIGAVGYRTGMLALLFHVVEQSPAEPLSQTLATLRNGDELNGALFRVMADIPLRWIPNEGMQGFPFDGEDFLKRVEQEAA
jgi:hypothetical protein